jgi:hypothetical protein
VGFEGAGAHGFHRVLPYDHGHFTMVTSWKRLQM